MYPPPAGGILQFHNSNLFAYEGYVPLWRACRLCRSTETSSVAQPVAVCARGACTPSCGRRMYRAQGSCFQPLHECERPVPSPASVVCTDNVIRSFSSSTGCCLSARGLSPLPRIRYFRRPRDAISADVHVVEACTRFHECRLYRQRETLVQCYPLPLFVRERPVPTPRAFCVPTRRGALSAAVRVRGACTTFRAGRLY